MRVRNDGVVVASTEKDEGIADQVRNDVLMSVRNDVLMSVRNDDLKMVRNNGVG
jgi:hypothetical protein